MGAFTTTHGLTLRSDRQLLAEISQDRAELLALASKIGEGLNPFRLFDQEHRAFRLSRPDGNLTKHQNPLT